MSNVDTTAFAAGVVEAGATPPEGTITIPVVPDQTVTPAVDPAALEAARNAAVEAARKQEKDKLYPEMNALKEQVRAMQDAETARLEAEAAAAEAIATAAREKEQSEMNAKELIAAKDAEYKAELAALKEDLAMRDTLLAKEQALNALVQHRTARLAEVGDQMLPHLADLVTGNTPDEVDASIETLLAKSAAILGDVQETISTYKQQMPGVSPAGAPPAGPSDPDMSFQTLTPEQLENMSLADFEKHRPALLRAASNQFYGR